jgi:RNA polymerase sigma-70 factor (ECF subfamily)
MREDFMPFYEREYGGLVALAASLIRDRSMAEDIAQEALLAAYGRWPEVSALESPIGWVRRVVTNKSVSLIRRRVAELRAVARLASGAASDSAYESDTDFWRLVRSLPRRQAQVVALHYVSDMTVVDIAAILGCQEGSVKASLFKARKNLMKRLEALDIDSLAEVSKPITGPGASRTQEAAI